MNKIILKNKNKYGNIKLAKGLDLDKFKTKKSKLKFTGISINQYRNVLFSLDKGDAYFKTYSSSLFFDLKKQRIVNEQICYELEKQLGIPCVEYEPAYNRYDMGLVSYKINNKYEKIIPAYKLVKEREVYLDKLLSKLKQVQKKYNFNINNIMSDLYKIMIFDIITVQCDRHSANVLFLYNKKQKELKVCPLMDNELSFAISLLYQNTEREKINSNIYWDDIEKNLQFFSRIRANSRIIYRISFREEIQDVVVLAKNNKELKKILISTIKNINIDNAINNLLEKGYKIDKSYVNYIKEIVNMTTCMIKEEMKVQHVTEFEENKIML